MKTNPWDPWKDNPEKPWDEINLTVSPVELAVNTGGTIVLLRFALLPEYDLCAFLTPEQARKLAESLMFSAVEVERNKREKNNGTI